MSERGGPGEQSGRLGRLPKLDQRLEDAVAQQVGVAGAPRAPAAPGGAEVLVVPSGLLLVPKRSVEALGAFSELQGPEAPRVVPPGPRGGPQGHCRPPGTSGARGPTVHAGDREREAVHLPAGLLGAPGSGGPSWALL